jgi:hypothetical protein
MYKSARENSRIKSLCHGHSRCAKWKLQSNLDEADGKIAACSSDCRHFQERLAIVRFVTLLEGVVIASELKSQLTPPTKDVPSVIFESEPRKPSVLWISLAPASHISWYVGRKIRITPTHQMRRRWEDVESSCPSLRCISSLFRREIAEWTCFCTFHTPSAVQNGRREGGNPIRCCVEYG